MARLSRKQRELFADTGLALVDASIVCRTGAWEDEQWRDGADATVRTVCETMGVDLDSFRKVWHEHAESDAGSGTRALPLASQRPSMPGARIEPDSYCGAIACGLEIVARIREGAP